MIHVSRHRALALLLLLYANSLLAGNGGSGYSRYGIGDIQYFVSGSGAGMGNVGLAVLSTSSINQFNPAAWTSLAQTRFSVGTLYEGYSTTDAQQSGYFSNMNFNGIMLSIPISTANGIVFGVGVIPYSTVNYSIKFDTSQAGLDYTLGYEGEGGVSEAQVGLSANLGNDIHLGTKMNYYFGTLRHTISQTFTNTSVYTNGQDLRSVDTKGLGFTFGAVYSGLASLLNFDKSRSLTLGLVATTTSYLSSSEEHQLTFSTSNLTTHDTETVRQAKITIPFCFGIGISYSSNRYLLAGDMFYQTWSKFDAAGLVSLPGRNSRRLGIGGELLPSKESSSKYGERMAYRMGIYYNSTYYLIKGEPINEIGITAGAGFPVFLDTRLNIGAEYSLRGTTDQQLEKERIIRISFTLSGGELWFQHPPEE